MKARRQALGADAAAHRLRAGDAERVERSRSRATPSQRDRSCAVSSGASIAASPVTSAQSAPGAEPVVRDACRSSRPRTRPFPATASRRGSPASGGRTPTTPSRRSNGRDSGEAGRSRRRTPRRAGSRCRRRRRPARRASTACSRAIAIASVRGSSLQPEASSIQAKASSPAAAGQRPSRSGYGRRAPRPPSAEPVALPSARHGLNAREHLAQEGARERHPDPEGDEDEGRCEVVERALIARSTPRRSTSSEQRDPDRAAAHVERRGPERPTERARERAPAGVLEPRAVATGRRAPRTRRSAPPRPPRRTATRGSAGWRAG